MAKKKNIFPNTRTSGEYNTEDWKELRRKIMDDFSSSEKWCDAFDKFFRNRIESRFLKPIEVIIKNIDSPKSGEGFAVTAILCILIEYLQAYYEGCIYTTSDHPNLYEYNSSNDLFRNFLIGHEPFKKEFKKTEADKFYNNVRCGLLHEAATKEDTKIRAEKDGLLLEKGSDGFIIYRNTLLKSLIAYLDKYREELIERDYLKVNFFRKIDELNGIKRELYFAYDCNMLKTKFEDESRMFVHTWHVARLDNYRFVFNKKNAISYATIEGQPGEVTWGVIYEIDKDDLNKRKSDYEGYAYHRHVKVTIDGNQVDAGTFISQNRRNNPHCHCDVKNILSGAEEKGLPTDYLEKISVYLYK